jgi:hypothetical protein
MGRSGGRDKNVAETVPYCFDFDGVQNSGSVTTQIFSWWQLD